MTKSEEELDRLHKETMENLYEIFEEEFDSYFKYHEAAIEVLAYGIGHFPFHGRMSDALTHIDSSLEAIEANILDHITSIMKNLWDERTVKTPKYSVHSNDLKKRLSESIKKSISEICVEK